MQIATAKNRLVTVDALRGMALLGIMLAHFIHWYTAGPLPEAVFNKYSDVGSGVAETFNNIFISGKFFSFFSFLFGLSFYLQMRGLEQDPKSFVSRYAWRLALLMVIGILHHTMWMGDILSIYVPLGFMLLVLRKLSDKWVLALGILLVVNVPGRILSVVEMLSGSASMGFGRDGNMANTYHAVVTNGSWADVFLYNIRHLSAKFDFQIFSGRLFITMGFFLLGMYTGRRQWFQNLEASRPVFRKICKRSALIMCLGLAIGLGIFAANELLKLGWQQDPVVGLVFMTVYDIFNASMVVFFVSGLTMLMYRARWQKLLFPLAPVGKMALTSYITQTVFGLLLFYGAGMGLYTKTSPGLNYLLAILFFGVQVVFSKWWLRYFNYGPLEWLWRSGTWLQWQPLLKKRKIQATPEPVVLQHTPPALDKAPTTIA